MTAISIASVKVMKRTREPDFVITNTANPSSIANDDNPTIVTAAVTSQSGDPNILTRIASVTADLTPLQLTGFSDPSGTDVINITTVPMLDDGTGEDAAAHDGIFTFAFGITTDSTAIGYERRHLHLLSSGSFYSSRPGSHHGNSGRHIR